MLCNYNFLLRVICDRVRGNRAYVGEIDIEIQAKTVGTISFVKVAFICLKFRVGIVESCQEVCSLSKVPPRNGGVLKADIAITAKPFLYAHFSG